MTSVAEQITSASPALNQRRARLIMLLKWTEERVSHGKRTTRKDMVSYLGLTFGLRPGKARDYIKTLSDAGIIKFRGSRVIGVDMNKFNEFVQLDMSERAGCV